MPLFRPIAAALAMAAALVAPPALARPRGTPPPGLRIERIVMLYRHGVRAPLDGEAAIEAYAHPPLPRWSTPASLLTPHGAAALRRLGAYQRQRFVAAGLWPARGCPTRRQVDMWTNTVSRTIASGHALAEGLAPGCDMAVGHLPTDQHDPLFEPLEAGAVPFDAAAAVADVNRHTGGAAALARPYAAAVRTFERVLGCDRVQPRCDILAAPAEIRVSDDGRGIGLRGAIDVTSGAAQVFMLQYLEGMPLRQVGWGRATPARLAQISRLHALLFDVFDRSPYLAPRIAGPMSRRLLRALAAPDAAAVTLLIGHDNNIAALAAVLGTHFRVPGYALDDPPPGGALGLELLRDRRSGARYVRAFYEAATPDQLRHLVTFGGRQRPARLPLALGLCGTRAGAPCSLARFRAALEARLHL